MQKLSRLNKEKGFALKVFQRARKNILRDDTNFQEWVGRWQHENQKHLHDLPIKQLIKNKQLARTGGWYTYSEHLILRKQLLIIS